MSNKDDFAKKFARLLKEIPRKGTSLADMQQMYNFAIVSMGTEIAKRFESLAANGNSRAKVPCDPVMYIASGYPHPIPHIAALDLAGYVFGIRDVPHEAAE